MRICTKGARRRKLDFLSFLTLMADYFFSFAKTFAGVVAVGIILMIARCLPSRIRRYFSACATVVLGVALLRNSVEQFAFFTIKTSLTYFAFMSITAFAVLFFVYVATYIVDCVFRSQIRVWGKRLLRLDQSRIVANFFEGDIVPSNAFLRISPIILQ